MTQPPDLDEKLLLFSILDMCDAIREAVTALSKHQYNDISHRNRIQQCLEQAIAHAQGRLVSPTIDEAQHAPKKKITPESITEFGPVTIGESEVRPVEVPIEEDPGPPDFAGVGLNAY